MVVVVVRQEPLQLALDALAFTRGNDTTIALATGCDPFD
jgi:hypothetical protein